MVSSICFNIETKEPLRKSVISRIFGNTPNLKEQFIDFDISIILLTEEGSMSDESGLIFYNQPAYKKDIIQIESHKYVHCRQPDYDEIVLIDFARLEPNINAIVFCLSNHQGFNFEIVDIKITIINNHFINENIQELNLKSDQSCNALELFKLKRISNAENWEIKPVINPIFDSNGLQALLIKYFSSKDGQRINK